MGRVGPTKPVPYRQDPCTRVAGPMSLQVKLIKLNLYLVINLLIRIRIIIRLLYIINPFFIIILRFNPIIVFLIRRFNIKGLPILNLNNYKPRVSILFTVRPDIPLTITFCVISFFKRTKPKLTLYIRNSPTTTSISK